MKTARKIVALFGLGIASLLGVALLFAVLASGWMLFSTEFTARVEAAAETEPGYFKVIDEGTILSDSEWNTKDMVIYYRVLVDPRTKVMYYSETTRVSYKVYPASTFTMLTDAEGNPLLYDDEEDLK